MTSYYYYLSRDTVTRVAETQKETRRREDFISWGGVFLRLVMMADSEMEVYQSSSGTTIIYGPVHEYPFPLYPFAMYRWKRIVGVARRDAGRLSTQSNAGSMEA